MKELYDNLFKSGDYTKSFEEFVNQFGDTEKSKVLYNALNESGDYTKSFEEFVVQFGFGEKKKTTDTSSSTLETEDMVSTTEEDPTDGSLDSSEVPEISIPQVTTPEVEDDYEYLKDDFLKLEEIETASTQTFTPGASARARAMREKNREVDPILKSKLLSDYNISSALEFNIINDRTLEAALKGNKNALKTIQSLSRKRKEEYLQEIQQKRLDKENAYEDSSNLNAYEITEDEKTKKDQAVKKVNDFNKETERLLSQIEKPTEEQLNEIFQRDGAPTEEEFELAEDSLTPTGFEDSDIDDMYDSQKLKNIKGFNAKDFDGYLSEMGYVEKYQQLLEDEVVSEDGRFYDISGNYNPKLAAERLKFQYLSNYINDKVERKVESQILKYQAENDGRHPSFDGVKIDFSTGLDDKAISSYVEEQFPTLTAYLKDRDRENQKNYQEYLNGENPWVTQSVKQGWRSVEDRISTTSEGVYEFIGMNNTADEIRMSAAQTELERDDFMRYTYASGKKATIDGREYGIDERGQIYDLQIKKNVTQVLTEGQEESIRKKVEGSDETFKSFSGAGAVIATSGIVSDMILQIALTRGVANLGAGGSAFLGAFDKGSKVLNVLSKIPMKANVASAMIAQGTLFGTNMSSDAYKKAIENGVDQETAEEIRQLASRQGYALGALTAPISTQITAMNKIFGEQGSKKISESVVRIYQESGKKGVNAYFQKIRQNIIQNYPVYFRESGKEMFQENVQQVGQAFIIADNVNELAGKEIMMNTITGAEYTNTTILAGMAGLLIPFGGDLTSSTGSSLKASFRPGEAAIDRMEALHALSRNPKKTKEVLDSMVKKGVYSQEQVNNIISDVDVYSKNIGRIPPNLTPETSLKVMGSLEKINQLEEQKKNLDKSFHSDIDKKIQDIRSQVTKATEFDYVNIKGKTKLKEEAGKQLTKEAEDRGEKDFTIADSAITERAIDNFSKMTIEEKLSYTDIQDAIQKQETEVDRKSRIDSAPKIFGKSHTDKKLPYGRAVIADITSPDSKGVQTAKYNNPQTGELDVIVSSSGDSANFVGFTRVYENGKPTNRFTAKMESTGDAFKNMITEAENALPDGAEVVETTTISIGGLKTYNKSKTLNEKVDSDGNVVTKTTRYSDATQQSVKEKGNESAFSSFRTNDKTKAEAEVEKIKEAYPGIEVKIKTQGSKRGKKTYTIDIELPVLVKTDAKPAEGVQEVETEVRVTPEQETEVESPIKDNLQENETIVQTRKDSKGRVFTTTKQESVRERDGLKTTKFKFNRDDKSTDQRNDAFAPEDVALAGTNLEINPEDRLNLQEGETATYEISEIREGDTGVNASVKFTTTDADGNQIGSFQGDVTLVETTVAPPTKPETKRFQDDQVVLKEETFTITNEDGSRQEVIVKTYLDGSFGTGARVKRFDSNGELIEDTGGFFQKLADNDIVVRDGITAEQQVEFIYAPGEEVFEKTSERSGNEINNPKKTAQLTTEQKQKLGIETKKDESEQTVSEIDEVTVTEEKVVPAGKRLFNNPNPETTEISKKYKKDRNNKTPDGEPITSIDKDNSREIADVYESLEDSPNDPKVQEAYSLMADETAAQHQEIIDAGYEVEIWNGEGEPYANAQEMIDDVRDNKHMWIYSTEAGFGDTAITEEQRQQNKLLQDSGFKDKNGNTLLYNDLFRFVHDFFGHTERGNGFGPVGEENAWDVHSRMYTPLARRAMTTETRGQNSWVNFGPKMRNKKGELIKKGEEGYLSPKDRPFAPQKMALMPGKYSEMLPEKQEDIDKSEQTQTQKDPTKALEKTKKDFEQSEQALKDRVKKPTLKERTRILREKIFDRQTRVKDLLKGVGNKQATKAKNLLVTKAGATGFANFRFKKADEKIYKGLKDQDLKTLDHIIYLRRLKAINENRKAQGKEPYVGINDTDYDTAVAALKGYENELGDKKYKDFSSRADTYFEAMNESLTRMKDSGLISEEVFNQLKDIDYSPIKTLDYIIPDNADAAEIDRMAEISGIKADVIKTLSDKNLKDIIMDTKWLLSSNLGMIEAKVFENKMLNAFSEAVESAEGDVKTEIENYVLPNPVTGETKDGKPKRKYDKKTPPGFTKVHFKKDGVDKYMVIDNAYANQLLDIKSNSRINLGNVGKLTGTNILRFTATSGNPLFIVGNTAVDFANILLLSDVYSNNKFKGGAELAFDFVKTFGSKVGGTKEYKKIYEEFMEHGGAMDYLSTDGLKAIGGRGKARSAAGKAFQSYGNFMSYLGETSEVSFRVAVYSKVKNNLLKDFEKENGRDPSKEEVEDIMNEAVREARETIDFSQGGSIVKAADKVLPYLNAGTQGLRKAVDYAAKNPKGFASSMLQAMIMAGGASAASMFMLLRSFGDDEDPEKVLEVLNSISDYEKSNYHILFTGEKDENGEHRYIRVKKLPTIGIASTIAEQLTIKAILKSRGIDYDLNDEALKKSASGISPIDVSQGLPGLINRNPLAAATLTYRYNYDHFYGQEVFKGPRNKKILPSAEGLLDDRVDQIYKDLGQAFGFSPKRSKAAVEKIITSEKTNPSIGLVYSVYDKMRGVVGETPTNNEIDNVMSRIVKNTERKLVRSTNKKLLSYKEQDEIKELETKLETGIYLKEKQAYNDIRKRYENNDPFTNEEFKKYILDNFPRLDAKKYAKKYVAYIKNMNGDRSILDIVFEDTPEVQAYRIYKKFGDSFDEDEKKEIIKVFKASRRKFSKKALYIYNQKYRKK